jgi:hypothetical protein
VVAKVGFRETGGATGRVRVEARFATEPGKEVTVATAIATGASGEVVSARLSADAISAVTCTPESGTLEAVLVDVCLEAIDPTGELPGWEPVPELTGPITLPVFHPDYPASGAKPLNLAAAETLALKRIRYGPQASWSGPPFKALHEQLVALVNGGPATPMASPTRSQPFTITATPPSAAPHAGAKHATAHPLQLVLAGCLHPAVAQMVGLYWLDDTARPGEVYDYLVIADRAGVAGPDAMKVLRHARNTRFALVDGWICFRKELGRSPPLEPPTGVSVYALPGGAVAGPEGPGAAVPVDASNNAGVTWDRAPAVALGTLHPGPVMFHVFREGRGNAATPGPGDAPKRLTDGFPVVVAEPRYSPMSFPVYPADWPPFRLAFLDRGLADGWYSYAVSGIDLFGRFTELSDRAQWKQWTPAPTPPPWYFKKQPLPGFVVHPDAVQLRDTIPPPPPTGVEAWALDPKDQFVVSDPPYQAWRNKAPSVVGLRVRWRWTVAQMRQAPDAATFRVYFHRGTNLPGPDWHDRSNWERRLAIVEVEDIALFTPDADGNRTYELFLPAAGGADRTELPLAPTPAEPIAYANVCVSAADAAPLTPDDPRWAGTLVGDRPGNESNPGTPCRVFRVLRDPPLPPGMPKDSDRVFATPADYHGRSFYTFRWRPLQHHRTHVLRALDDAVFQTDWAQRPGKVLSASSPVFPSEQIDPQWDEQKRKQIAAELNGLNAFPYDPTSIAGRTAAMAAYRKLSNDGLRVLASLKECEAAFAQLTSQPLDSDKYPNKIGPDNPPGFVIDRGLCAYVDTLDGRGTGRWFYRAQLVDGAQNRGAMGISSPPVCLPNVVPPRAPAVIKVVGGDRRVTLTWASNREEDLKEYRVYRCVSSAFTSDIRDMTLLGTFQVPERPPARPAIFDPPFVDSTIPGLVQHHYAVVAVDTAGNISTPAVVTAKATDESPPSVPTGVTATWVKVDATGAFHPFDDPTPGCTPMVRVAWPAAPELEFLVQRRVKGDGMWATRAAWQIGQGLFFDHTVNEATLYEFRVIARKTNGLTAVSAAVAATHP